MYKVSCQYIYKKQGIYFLTSYISLNFGFFQTFEPYICTNIDIYV